MTTTALVLAAGASKRLGRPKQLLTVDGETLIARATRIAMEATGRVVVVVAEGNEGLVQPSPGITVVVNEGAAEGIASSIRRGVEACDGDMLLVLCDQPRITVAHLRALVDAGAPIAATAYAGILGVPAFFSRAYRSELLALCGDTGARRVIEAQREGVVEVPFEEAGVDIDKEEDLQSL